MNVCFADVSVHNAGSENGKSNAFRISPGSLSGLVFSGARALNSNVGFALHESTGISNAVFMSHVNPTTGKVTNTEASDNQNSGFQVRGGTTFMFDVTARNNGADGIRIFSSAQIENAHVLGNLDAGIEGTDAQGVIRIFGSTVVGNGKGIVSNHTGTNLHVHNTIISNNPGYAVELTGSGTAICSHNLFFSSGSNDGCTGTGDKSGNPQFDTAAPSTKSYLLPSSPAWDAGRNPSAAPAINWVFLGKVQDHDRNTRPLDTGYEMGAFEGEPQSQPTPGPGPDCLVDCDNDGVVRINELLRAVNISLGHQPMGVCVNADADGNDRITISELVMGVRNSLNGCSSNMPGTVSLSRVLALSHPQGNRGQSVPVIVSINDSVAGLGVDILVDAGVAEAIDPNNDCVLASGLNAANYILGSTVTPSEEVPAGKVGLRLIISGRGDNGSVHTLPAGVVATCTFQIGSNAPFAVHNLTTQAVELCNANANVYQNVTVNAGSIEVCNGCCP
jgi:hypothetical protein